jgi:hypothetical protein
MPTYLLHLTGDGTPAGVFTDQSDYYDPEWSQLRQAGREIVYSKPADVDWQTFIERAASSAPSSTMRWDTYYDSSTNLSVVLSHAQRDLERSGYPEPE